MEKNEIYKISFSKHHVQKFKDSSDIKLRRRIDDALEVNVKHPLFIHSGETLHDEKSFVENFANPLTMVARTYAMVVIEELGEKISLKVFHGVKSRGVGRTWFKINRNVEYITINRKTGDVYYGFLHNYQKKRKFTRKIMRNVFISDPVNSFMAKMNNILSDYCNNSSTVTHTVMSVFFEQFRDEAPNLDLSQRILKFYLDKKQIKYSNNFWIFTSEMWGDKYRKALKKNDKKVIDAVMFVNDLRGKKIKKYLHVAENLNFKLLKFAIKVFGENWLNQDGDVILRILNSKFVMDGFQFDNPEIFTNEELKKVYSCFKSVLDENFTSIWSFSDHLRFYSDLKAFGETDLRWTSDGTLNEKFQNEHLDWTEKLDHYRRGFYTRYYPKYFVKNIETNIGQYFPVLLKDSSDYNSESNIQSNCVKSYIGRVSSFIVSLRRGSVDSTERATIEYRMVYLKNFDKIHVDRVQTLGRYNQNLDPSWNDVLLKLDEIVLSSVTDERFETVQIEKVCKNGVKLSSGSHFNEDGNLIWTNKKTNFNNNWEW